MDVSDRNSTQGKRSGGKAQRRKWTYHETQYFLEILKSYHAELRKGGCGKKWCLWDKVKEQHQVRFPSSRNSLDYYYKYGNLMHSYRVECERRILENDTFESCERNFPHFSSFHQLLQETDHPLHLNAGSSIQFVPSKEQKRLNTRMINEREQDDQLQPAIADGCPEFTLPHELPHGLHSTHSLGMSHPATATVSIHSGHLHTHSHSHPHSHPHAHGIPHTHAPANVPVVSYEAKHTAKLTSASKKRPVEDSVLETLKEISAKIDTALGPDSAFEKYFQMKAEITRMKLMRLKSQDMVASSSNSTPAAES